MKEKFSEWLTVELDLYQEQYSFDKAVGHSGLRAKKRGKIVIGSVSSAACRDEWL